MEYNPKTFYKAGDTCVLNGVEYTCTSATQGTNPKTSKAWAKGRVIFKEEPAPIEKLPIRTVVKTKPEDKSLRQKFEQMVENTVTKEVEVEDLGSDFLKTYKENKIIKGAQGPKGDKGDTGATGAQGPKGDKGDKGDSIKGDKGKDGKDGTSLEFVWEDTKLGIKTTEDKEYKYVDLKGEKGDSGKDGNDKYLIGSGSKFVLSSAGTGHSLIFNAKPRAASLNSLVAGSNVTITNDGLGNLTIASSGGGGGVVDSVNGLTGVVVLDADDIDDTSTSHKFVTAGDLTKLSNLSGTNTGDQDLSGYLTSAAAALAYQPLASVLTNTTASFTTTLETKLNGIEALADVTDATNVAAAGAFMKSVDDTDDITVGATNKFATAAEKTKLGFITVTQAVDLDTLESDTATNNAKVTNATHTGDVTGATALTLQSVAITGQAAVTPLGADYILISDTSDSGNLKKALISNLPLTAVPDADYGDITVSGGVWNIDVGVVTETELNASVNASLDLADTAIQNLSDLGITATASELNILDGAILTVTELNYVDGVTSAIQTQLDSKLSTATAASTYIPLSYLDTDVTLTANSDVKIATQKAVKAYADGLIAAANATIYKGATDCSANPNYPAADAGWLYRVSVAGKIGGASGVVVEAGDMFICTTDGTVSGDQATVGTSWNVIQTNIDGAVVGPSSATDGNIVLFDGTTGKLVKNSAVSPSSFQTADATLTALAAYNTNGLLTQTAGDTFTGRTLTGTANRITVTNGDGVSGNPTIDLHTSYIGQNTITTLGTISTGVWQGTAIGDTYISSAATWNSKQAGDTTLTALAAYNTNGILTQTAADTFTGRTITGTANQVTVTNGDGVSGNPTLSLPATINVNTSGSAATLTTTRTIWGQNFNGSANVTGDIALGASNITMTGSLAATGARVTKGWFTDIESTNAPTIGGSAATGSGGLVRATSPTLVTPVLGAASATSLSFSSTSGIIGTNTNDSAAAGSVGEYVESIVASGSAVSLTSGITANVTSISLTAGDWDVTGSMRCILGAGTNITYFQGTITTTSGSLSSSLPENGFARWIGNLTGTGNDPAIVLGTRRMSLSATTTVYMTVQSGFSVSTNAAYGFIRARRVR